MTREEHLKFCKKCTNRTFDTKQGIICKLTDKIADFEGDCKHFEHDESTDHENLNQDNLPEGRTNLENISKLPEEIKDKLRSHQELLYAIVGGFFLSIICALIWAVVTVGTEYQIGFMAIGVGIVVGMGVRFFGAGIDPVYGFIGAIFALLGCVLGNLFSQVGFAANAESLGYFQMLSLLDLETIILILEESFQGIDILFYGFAVFEGYKFAFRPIPADIKQKTDFTPQYAKLRLPLVVISFVVISFTGYALTEEANGDKTFYYESGKVLSTGPYINGNLNGTWNYFYEDGKTQATAEYDNGIENGNWVWYFQNGQVMRKGVYNKGLIEGVWLNYYENGVVSDSSNYKLGRLSGESVNYYENGQIMRKGNFIRDRQDGLWKQFFDNGQLLSEGNFNYGEHTGLWKFWTIERKPLQELQHVNSDDFKILNVWDKNGQLIVKNGFGEYQSYHEDGTLQTIGTVKNGLKDDIWKIYHLNGKLKEEGIYKVGDYKLLNTWSDDAEPQVIDGEGDYITYHQNTTFISEKGLIKNGLKEGIWLVYQANSFDIQQESNYSQGKLNGRIIVYNLDGSIYIEGNYTNGIMEGEWKWNYESGSIQSTVNYVNDKKEGTQLFWSESGPKNKEEIYENGELISENILSN